MSKEKIMAHKIIILVAALVSGMIIGDIDNGNFAKRSLLEAIVYLIIFGLIILVALIQSEKDLSNQLDKEVKE